MVRAVDGLNGERTNVVKSSSKFERGGKLEHLMHEGKDAGVYVEVRRRLAVLKANLEASERRGDAAEGVAAAS